MRDHNKLHAFRLADDLAVAVYRHTASYPEAERFGRTSQLRRAAVSVPSNIVEGCAKSSQADYLRFLDIAYGSSCEVQYQLSLAHRLGMADEARFREISNMAVETSKILGGLIRSLRPKTQNPKPKTQNLKPKTQNLKPEA
jgi:four helix bundle protein